MSEDDDKPTEEEREQIKRQIKEEERQEEEYGAEIQRIERAHNLTDQYVQGIGVVLANARLHTPFVINEAVPEGFIAFIAGKPGCGKTWLAYDAALAVARARPWLGFGVPQPGKVLILNYDNPPRELGRQMLRLGAKDDDPIFVHSIATVLPPEGLPGILQIPDFIEQVCMIISVVRPRLIVVDSLRQAHTGDEGSSRDMSRVMSCLRQMTQYNSALLVVHHLRKSPVGKHDEDEDPLRGSGEIEASLDVVMLTRGGTLQLRKTRGWKPQLRECDYEITDDGDSTIIKTGQTFAVLVAAMADGEPRTRRDIAAALVLTQDAASRLVDRALEADIIEDYRRGKGTRSFILSERGGNAPAR